MSKFLSTLGVLFIVAFILFVVFIPPIAGVIIAMALAGWLGVSGILWWAIVIVVTLIIWGILGKLYNNK